MTIVVNDSVREAVLIALHRRRMTRRQLAELAGLSAPYITRLLNGDVEGGREAWEAIFDVLDLTLTAVPKSDA